MSKEKKYYLPLGRSELFEVHHVNCDTDWYYSKISLEQGDKTVIYKAKEKYSEANIINIKSLNETQLFQFLDILSKQSMTQLKAGSKVKIDVDSLLEYPDLRSEKFLKQLEECRDVEFEIENINEFLLAELKDFPYTFSLEYLINLN